MRAQSTPEVTDLLEAADHEQVTVCRDPEAGYVGIVAVHSSRLGPAVGGTRLWRYPALADATADALRLSRGMTYKNALAGLPFGGGKAVVIDPGPRTEAERSALFRAHGRFIDRLGGLFVTGEDVGTSPDDMATISTETRHVAGLSSGMGDPSPFTALGVFRAIEAVAEDVWGDRALTGRTVAIQGLGNVGMRLARLLAEGGAGLFVTDIDSERVRAAQSELGAVAVAPDEIVDADVDLFAPCAFGGVLDEDGVERIRARVVCGGANNQLATPQNGRRLAERGIAYVPDFVANAGGVISGSVDIAGWDQERMSDAIDGIADTTREVLRIARADRLSTHDAAERLAEERLREA